MSAGGEAAANALPTVEEHLQAFLKQPGAFILPGEYEFIADMRKAASAGVGYGWMMSIIEIEWNRSLGKRHWGPSYFSERIDRLEAEVRRLGGDPRAV